MEFNRMDLTKENLTCNLNG
ncbi:hypothetical protein Mgra_00009977 [Meloidogyne graminicola]|uniref:Uncharacterized protein n=1 Tax=Meloidogyne graminicola TaxID=189291 RepID=A0A8S9ZBJ5_9BILA|nr:hypothetical protein Mgra_00009977 [Meloidogyne graminicola]